MNPPLHSALLCWALNRRVQNENSLTPPRRMLKKKRGSVTSALDAEIDASMGEENRSLWVPSSGALC